MRKRIRLTESDLYRIVEESVKTVLKEGYGKGEKYTYETEDGDTANCEFITSTFEDGYPYSVGLIDHYKKEVYPCHGYHYPNRCANGLMKTALSLGYIYVDSEMPSEKNKTLLKKYYKSGRKEYRDLDRMHRVHQLRNDEFPTTSYQGETYTIDDPLPDAPIYVHFTGASYAWNIYPNIGESLREYIERNGESIEDVIDWWIGD